jgi:HAD superfamily hydrolase (TIGR01549 family)
VFRPGFDLEKARQQRAADGKPEWFAEDDLHPDVRPALTRLRAGGLWVGIAGNQTARAGSILRGLGLPADMIATSDDWGAAKPDPEFFEKMIEVSPSAPGETLYVGDRLDNDIVPAARLGLRTALINRGPWAIIWRDDPAASQVPTLRIDSLAELPARIAAFNAGAC